MLVLAGFKRKKQGKKKTRKCDRRYLKECYGDLTVSVYALIPAGEVAEFDIVGFLCCVLELHAIEFSQKSLTVNKNSWLFEVLSLFVRLVFV